MFLITIEIENITDFFFSDIDRKLLVSEAFSEAVQKFMDHFMKAIIISFLR